MRPDNGCFAKARILRVPLATGKNGTSDVQSYPFKVFTRLPQVSMVFPK